MKSWSNIQISARDPEIIKINNLEKELGRLHDRICQLNWRIKMRINILEIDRTYVAEIISDKILISEVQDALDLMVDCVKLAIVGDFSEYSSKSLKDFIRESNKSGRVSFVSSVKEAKDKIVKN